MRLHRFYVLGGDFQNGEIKVSDSNFVHQLKDVFRLKVDDKVILFFGDGADHLVSIESITKKEILLKKISETRTNIEKRKIRLYMAVIKKENFELVIQKAVELGVTEIIPLITERTLQKTLNTDRLQKIIIESSEQCGRGNIPTMSKPKKLNEVLVQNNLIAFDILGEAYQQINSEREEVSILIGPEGGWSDDEKKSFVENEVRVFNLGKNTLRAETAAIVAISRFTI